MDGAIDPEDRKQSITKISLSDCIRHPRSAQYTRGAGNDHLWGGNHNDQLPGDAEDGILNGGAGTDSLFGGPGDDVLIGQEARATADFLNGGAGNDVLHSGGADSLHGGSGQDLFQIITAASAPEDLTEISDFNPIQDHIEIWINDQQQTDPIIEISQNNAGRSLVWLNQNPILSVLSEEKTDCGSYYSTPWSRKRLIFAFHLQQNRLERRFSQAMLG